MFDWADYLVVAKTLAIQQDQGSRRAAVSRAYYAAYGVVCDYVGSRRVYEDTTGKSFGPHEQVWEVLRSEPVSIEQETREELLTNAKTLKDSRLVADYKKHKHFVSAQVEQVLAKANELISAIKQLPRLPAQESPAIVTKR